MKSVKSSLFGITNQRKLFMKANRQLGSKIIFGQPEHHSNLTITFHQKQNLFFIHPPTTQFCQNLNQSSPLILEELNTTYMT